jgi:hypothetical protein
VELTCSHLWVVPRRQWRAVFRTSQRRMPRRLRHSRLSTPMATVAVLAATMAAMMTMVLLMLLIVQRVVADKIGVRAQMQFFGALSSASHFGQFNRSIAGFHFHYGADKTPPTRSPEHAAAAPATETRS